MTEAEPQVTDLDALSIEATGQTIIYDSREVSKVIDRLKASPHLGGFQFVRKTLPVGDYIVNGTVIERKTPEDFLSSIYNKSRLNNQLFEMSRNCDFSVLVITGDPYTAARSPVDRAVIASARIGVWLRNATDGKQGVVVLHELEGEKEFPEFLAKVAKKERIRRLKLAKSKVSDSDHMVLTLMTVPGWGEKLARAGLEMYGSISNMLDLTENELAKIEGVAKGKAKAFYEHFRREYQG